MKRLTRSESGQSSTEYLTVLLLVTALLTVGYGNQPSVIMFFLNAVKEGFERFSSFISLPL
jgi:Flp pilus assembly pilin Flp